MKAKHNIFLRLMLFLFIIFIVLYIMTKTGYYENKLHEKTILTDEKIKQFEADIKEGKEISLDSYYIEEKPDYSSTISNLGKNISNKASSNIINFFTQFGKVLKKLFW